MHARFSLRSGDKPVRGRFAPSPTGRMHLGNVCAALLSWLSVKLKDGKWILRIEDIDTQRSREEYARLLEDDLLWMGLEWDEGGYDAVGPCGPYRQSLRGEYYEEVLNRLRETGLVYPCRCTRAELRVSSAPHQDDGRILYGGRCRPPEVEEIWNTGVYKRVHAIKDDADGAMRIYAPDAYISFNDLISGTQTFNLKNDCGDFVLRRRDGAWAYQLAVAADDIAMEITEVVRGDDLLLSTAQQIYLMRLLGADVPAYGHFPLLRNESGQRLSKRDDSLNMEALRSVNSPQEIIGRVAFLAGLLPESTPISPAELVDYLKKA